MDIHHGWSNHMEAFWLLYGPRSRTSDIEFEVGTSETCIGDFRTHDVPSRPYSPIDDSLLGRGLTEFRIHPSSRRFSAAQNVSSYRRIVGCYQGVRICWDVRYVTYWSTLCWECLVVTFSIGRSVAYVRWLRLVRPCYPPVPQTLEFWISGFWILKENEWTGKRPAEKMMGSDALPQDTLRQHLHKTFMIEEKCPSRKNSCLMYPYTTYIVFEVLPSGSGQYIFKYLMKLRKNTEIGSHKDETETENLQALTTAGALLVRILMKYGIQTFPTKFSIKVQRGFSY